MEPQPSRASLVLNLTATVSTAENSRFRRDLSFAYLYGTGSLVENAVDAVEKAYARCGAATASAKTPNAL